MGWWVVNPSQSPKTLDLSFALHLRLPHQVMSYIPLRAKMYCLNIVLKIRPYAEIWDNPENSEIPRGVPYHSSRRKFQIIVQTIRFPIELTTSGKFHVSIFNTLFWARWWDYFLEWPFKKGGNLHSNDKDNNTINSYVKTL